MNCVRCGSELPKGATICSRCGCKNEMVEHSRIKEIIIFVMTMVSEFLILQNLLFILEDVKDYIKEEYTIYEKIINLCDLMCTTKVLTVDKRMMDLLLRHGIYAKTYYHIEETVKLKEFFDNLLDYNLYDLFPEIKDNL